MSPSLPPARFIAGAVCPACRAMDRIVLESLEDGSRRRCVTCGYTDTLSNRASAEPATRLTRRRAGDTPAAPVRIVDPARDADERQR